MTGATLAMRPGERVPSSTERRIEGIGTREAAWRDCAPLRSLPAFDVDRLAAHHRAIWLVAPHPDDEVLGAGGLLARLSRVTTEPRADLCIVAVTDGAASHPGSDAWTPERLRTTRRDERAAALATLGVVARTIELRVPDGAATRDEAAIDAALADLFGPDDFVIAPWRLDGHPDHEASGRAARAAADRAGAGFAEYPIWAWHWGDAAAPPFPLDRARKVALDPALVDAKCAAIRCFASQTAPDGPRDAVLPPHVVERFERDFELLFVAP